MNTKSIITSVVAAALLAVALTVWLPRTGERPKGRAAGPILVLGIDGAEWDVMEPLLERGDLPNLRGLIDGGASGRLRSLEPRNWSPVIWTTIATGKRPKEHGITGLVEGTRQPGTLATSSFSSNMWRARSLWDIVGGAGLNVGVIGWLVTWPACEVRGFMVSQHAKYIAHFGDVGEGKEVTYPPELMGRIAPVVRDKESVTEQELARFVDLETELGLSALDGMNEKALRAAISGDETVTGVALLLLKDGVPDLTCVYMRGVDDICHKFWFYMDPETRPPYDPTKAGSVGLEKQAAPLGALIEKYYRYTDEQVGRLLDLFPEDATVVVCSDHGFRGPGKWGEHPPWRGWDQHSLEGIIILKGPGIEPGVAIEGATVYDVAPTVLALAGVAVGKDMPGRVLTEALSSRFVESQPVRFVESHETEPHKGEGEEPIESPVDDMVRERLRALGYIE